MKLLVFNNYRVGVLKGDRVVDVSGAAPHTEFLSRGPLGAEAVMEEVIEGWDHIKPNFEAIVAREAGVPLAEVTLHPPLPRPPNALCCFSNYQDRAMPAESKPPVYGLDFFHKSATSMVGSGATVELPDLPEAVVFQPEPEFAYVIGKRGKNVPEANALDYVFGYTNFVDVSARGIPNRRTTFLHKSLDGWAPMGPVITTKDEIPDPQNVTVRLWLNGELKQEYNTSAMLHWIAPQISWLSQLITLSPGDVVSCGVHHVGLQPINEGDRVEVEGEGLERLRFTVKSYGPRKDAHWRPPGTRDA
jgi:2-keto-4-pentenoate hydratase/2-oxohepta-3-ene-1,7-dioic acid hydratase in catechol pathway